MGHKKRNSKNRALFLGTPLQQILLVISWCQVAHCYFFLFFLLKAFILSPTLVMTLLLVGCICVYNDVDWIVYLVWYINTKNMKPRRHVSSENMFMWKYINWNYPQETNHALQINYVSNCIVIWIVSMDIKTVIGSKVWHAR